MKINKFEQKGYTITMEVEEDYSVIDSFMEESFNEIAKDAKVPGFRKGKVPRDVFEKNYGKGPILEKSINKAMNKAYLSVLEGKKLFPVDYPKNIEMKKLEEGKIFVFSMDLDVKPEVKLGKYKGVKAEKKTAKVEDKDVENQLKQIQENQAEFILVENRAVKDEDIVSYDIQATIDGKSYEKWTKKNSGCKIGSKSISEDFDKALIGMKAGETKDIKIEFKKDHFDKDVAGKKVEFNVLLNEIRERKLPELNDELVQKISPFKTLDELKKDMKEKMQKQMEEQNEGKLKEDLLKEVIKGTNIDLPPIMIEREIDRMLQNMEFSLTQSKIKMDDYLKILGKDKKALREEYKKPAEERAKLNLILEEISKKENIEASAEDLDAELTKIAQQVKGQSVEESKEKVSEGTKEYVKSYLQDEKTIEFLINHAKIVQK